eukprot:1693741-Amphidinium_carterae.2
MLGAAQASQPEDGQVSAKLSKALTHFKTQGFATLLAGRVKCLKEGASIGACAAIGNTWPWSMSSQHNVSVS